eukprot:TRINITY_DN2317_c2_g1_i1.p1 TRINITY_DN2317_c2_g1~~TRINITY_DN2317_c2_g1_i1.p1  ORF type:complete len:1128 (-),score=268.79 TRINITY_DN2317_c2_g1_i1:37-2925(-)
MTTEILRSMLYRGDKGLSQVKWVIFDEVHYVNDADRGVVWEEVIILLAAEVSMVMLSATVPNYREFAGWIGRTKRRPVYTVHTNYRPTPLRHHLSFRGHELCLLDGDGYHLEAFQQAKELQNEKVKQAPRPLRRVSVTFETRPFGMTPMKQDPSGASVACYVVEKVNHNDPSKPAARLGVKAGWTVVSVNDQDVTGLSLDDVQQMSKEAPLPVTLEFEVPENKKDSSGNSATGYSEKHRGGQAQKHQQNAPKAAPPQSRESREKTETQRLQSLLRTLEAESKLPATVFVFSRRRVEALATEMPNFDVCTAEERSKVHTFLKLSFERLSEADRALPQVCRVEELARRGIGIHHGGLLPVVKEAVEIMFSRGLVKVLIATETFAMGVNMPARSVIFTAWTKHDGTQRRVLLPSEYTQMAGRAGRRGLDDEGFVYLLSGDTPPDQKQITRMMTHKAEPLNSRFRITFAMILQLKRFAHSGVRVEDLLGRSFLENARAVRRPAARRDLQQRMQELDALPPVECVFGEPKMEEYAVWESEVRGLGSALHLRLFEPKTRDKVFCLGRAMRVFKPGVFASADGALVGLCGDRQLRVAVLLPQNSIGLDASGSQGSSSKQFLLTSNSGSEEAEQWTLSIEELPLSSVLQLFEQCADRSTCAEASPESEPEALEASSAITAAAACRLGQELLALRKTGWQPLVMTKATKQVELDFYETLLRQRELQAKQDSSKCHLCPLKFKHYNQVTQRTNLATDIEDLDRELGSESLGLLPQLQAKERVLRDLGCLDDEGLITLKGRTLTEVLSGDEVTIAEVVFNNLLDGCTPEEVASAVSSFVFPDKADDEDAELEPLPENLARVRAGLLEQHRRVEELLSRQRVEVDWEEFGRTCNVRLMGLAYRWACGENLADLMPDTYLQEGAIVRAIVRAEELLRKLHDVAKMLGNDTQQETFAKAADIIHRDIAFVPSLYIK